MATLAVQTINRTGVVPTYNACAGGGDKFPTTGVEFLHFKNASVGDITVTIAINATVDGLAVASRTVLVAAGTEKLVGPFPASVYADNSGLVDLTYSGVTTFSVAVLAPGV